jgi:NADP-dependent 3-hydroxy acid dehydrogenase YdfG
MSPSGMSDSSDRLRETMSARRIRTASVAPWSVSASSSSAITSPDTSRPSASFTHSVSYARPTTALGARMFSSR